MVYGKAEVCGKARVYGEARVYGKAEVCGEAEVYGKARVYGEAMVCGKAEVCGEIINLIGFKYNITICDNIIQVGCKQFKKSSFQTLKYVQVKNDCDFATFKYLKRIILTIINNK